MEIKDRIIQFIEYKGITRNKFETSCGLPVRYVSNIGKTIQSDAIKKIILTYSEINLYWLITGIGSMLYEDGNSSSGSGELVKSLRGQIAHLEGEVAYLREQNMLLLKDEKGRAAV